MFHCEIGGMVAVYIISAIKSTNFLSLSAAVSQFLPEIDFPFSFVPFTKKIGLDNSQPEVKEQTCWNSNI